MRRSILILSLAAAVLIMAPTYAQEQDKDAIKIAVSDTIVGDEDKAEEGFNISVNIGDDESSADEKLRNAANKLSKVFGKEFGEEMKLELDGMSNAEKEKVIKALSTGFTIDSGSSDGLSISESVIAFTAIILSLGMPIIIVLLILVFAYRKRRQKMDLVRTYLDAGKDVPDAVLAEFSGGSANSLKSGVTPLAIGAGMIAAAFVLDDATPLAAIGLIPLFIGLARLAYWRFESKDQ